MIGGDERIWAIDTVVNPHTPEIVKMRPDWSGRFHQSKFGRDQSVMNGYTYEDMLLQMDAAGIEKAFLVANKTGQLGLPGSWHLPYDIVAEAVRRFPDRFYGLAGLDPTEGMDGVRAFERAIVELGFIGAHAYPHWFELAPDNARWYPFYSKCIELEVPILMQVGQSLVYEPRDIRFERRTFPQTSAEANRSCMPPHCLQSFLGVAACHPLQRLPHELHRTCFHIQVLPLLRVGVIGGILRILHLGGGRGCQ